MLALAARAMGYRIAVLDPDPDCPAAAVADRVVVAGYDDVGGALRLAETSDVVTYELEHVAAAVVDAVDAVRPVRPGRGAAASHPGPHRGAPLRGVRRRRGRRRGARSVAPTTSARPRPSSGLPLRLKVATGGYDGRGQLRAGRPRPTRMTPWRASGARPASPSWPRRELAFAAELSIVVARGSRRADRDVPARAQPARRRHPRRERGAGADRRERRGPCRRPRRAAGGGDGPDRHADRRAVPHARRPARRQRAGAARPQQRPLDDRGRRDLAVRAAHPGDLRPRPRLDRGARPDAPSSTCWAPGPARRRASRAASAWRVPWPTRRSISTSTTSGRCSNAARWAT